MVELNFEGDARGPWQAQLALPESPGGQPKLISLVAQQEHQSSATGLPFRLSNLPNLFESGDNNQWSTQALENSKTDSVFEIPLAFNGRLEQPLDRDCIWLRGIAGERFLAEVFAFRLGSPADTLLSVVDSSQRVLARCDDSDSLDSRIEFVVPDDNIFGIAIEEKGGKGGPGFAYRLEVTPARPTAEVYLPRRDRMSQEMQTIAIPVGNRVLTLLAVRKDDAAGQATIRFPELPKGTTAHFIQPKQDQAIVPVVFEASASTELVGQLIPVETTVLAAGGTAVGQFHQVTDLVHGPADTIYSEHHADRLAICTRTAYPVSITVQQPQTSLAQDGTIDIVVNVERHGTFSGNVELLLPWLPPWIDAEPRVTVPANESQALIRLRAWSQAEVQTWPLVVEAHAQNAPVRRGSRAVGAASGGTGTATPALVLGGDSPPPTSLFPMAVASKPVELSITTPPARGHFEIAAGEQGESIDMACSVRFESNASSFGNLVATLEGLPNRVDCDSVKVDATTQWIRFKVRLQSSAPLGQYSGLACRLTGTQNGQTISFVIARDGSLTIGEPGKIIRDDSGRP